MVFYLAEHEIFGEALSDSDEERESKVNVMESDDENSEDSRGSGSEFYAENSNLVSSLLLPTPYDFTVRYRAREQCQLNLVVICSVMIAARQPCLPKRNQWNPRKV